MPPAAEAAEEAAVAQPRFALNPGELYFSLPLTRSIETQLNITLLSDQPACFKVKTTTPERYNVYPRLGFIGPGDTKTVTITYRLRGHDSPDWEPEDAAKIKDKFQIEMCTLAPSELGVKRACDARDFAAARRLLGVTGTDAAPKSKPRSTRDEVAEVVSHLLKQGDRCFSKQSLSCHFVPADQLPPGIMNHTGGDLGASSPLAAAQLKAQPAGGGGAPLAARPAPAPAAAAAASSEPLDESAERHRELLQLQAVSQELAGKTQCRTLSMSFRFFAFLVVMAFYLGLVHHRWMPQFVASDPPTAEL